MSSSLLSFKKFLQAFSTWWILWAVFQVVVLYWMGIELREAFIDSLTFNLLTVASCLLIIHVMQFYLPQQERYWYILFISILMSSLVVMGGIIILIHVNGRNPAYVKLLNSSIPIRYGISFLLIACMTMISVLWYSFQEQKEKEKRHADASQLAKEAELFKLRLQLQPHFLFNSLNSISALVTSQPGEARHMIHQLSDFLRGTVRKEDHEFVMLSSELEHLNLYLEIEKVRFGKRLQTVIDAGEECRQIKMPPLLLQPVVENAIKFGLYDTLDVVTITIRAVVKNQYLVITIQNPFDPETAQPIKGEGFGLSSLKRRLYLLFARNDLVNSTAVDGEFTTTIRIPVDLETGN